MAAKKGKRGRKPVGGTQRFALVPAKLGMEHPDPEKQRAIAAYLRHGTIAAACEAALVGRRTWYDWLAADAHFAQLAAEARQHRNDALEQEAERRALTGSDTLLIFLLKAANPDKFRDRKILTEISAEVRMRVQNTLQLIASKAQWESEELINALNEVWR